MLFSIGRNWGAAPAAVATSSRWLFLFCPFLWVDFSFFTFNLILLMLVLLLLYHFLQDIQSTWSCSFSFVFLASWYTFLTLPLQSKDDNLVFSLGACQSVVPAPRVLTRCKEQPSGWETSIFETIWVFQVFNVLCSWVFCVITCVLLKTPINVEHRKQKRCCGLFDPRTAQFLHFRATCQVKGDNSATCVKLNLNKHYFSQSRVQTFYRLCLCIVLQWFVLSKNDSSSLW